MNLEEKKAEKKICIEVFGSIVRRERLRQNLSQQELCDLAKKITGIKLYRSTISNLETKKSSVSGKTMYALGKTLGLSMEELSEECARRLARLYSRDGDQEE